MSKQFMGEMAILVGEVVAIPTGEDGKTFLENFIKEAVADKLALLEQEPTDRDVFSEAFVAAEEEGCICGACGGTGGGWSPEGNCLVCNGSGIA
jgi:hypothetical protein